MYGFAIALLHIFFVPCLKIFASDFEKVAPRPFVELSDPAVLKA